MITHTHTHTQKTCKAASSSPIFSPNMGVHGFEEVGGEISRWKDRDKRRVIYTPKSYQTFPYISRIDAKNIFPHTPAPQTQKFSSPHVWPSFRMGYPTHKAWPRLLVGARKKAGGGLYEWKYVVLDHNDVFVLSPTWWIGWKLEFMMGDLLFKQRDSSALDRQVELLANYLDLLINRSISWRSRNPWLMSPNCSKSVLPFYLLFISHFVLHH